MGKIVTHPLYIKTKKVLDSCKTSEQFKTACNYWLLAKKKTRPERFSREWWDHKILWQLMIEGYKK
jgi:hypothetical protein